MRNRKRTGSISMMILVGMSVLLTISLGVSGLAITNLTRTTRTRNSILAYHAAQAGLELMSAKAVAAAYTNAGAFTSDSRDLSSTISQMLGGSTASATITPMSDPTYAWVTCTVSYNHFTRSVRQLINAKNVSIWNNAIFAGTGASGQSINGNVDIRGSVHMLGDGEEYLDTNGNGQWDAAETYTDKNKNGKWDPGEAYTDANGNGKYDAAEPYNDTNLNGAYDPPFTQATLDAALSGNGDIGNNYAGIPSIIQTTIPNPPLINNIQTLSTEVRVKHGKIALSGASTIGTNGVVNGGTVKGTVDGTYVNDGWGGTKGAASVFSDNGTTNQYDLAPLGIKFPLISGIGAPQYVDKAGTVWNTEEDYLDNRGLTCPVSTITSTTAAFSYGPDAYGNSISFTPKTSSAPCALTINGVIRFAGDVQLGSKDSIYYKGNGTLFSKGSIYVDGDVLPVSGYVFPTTARVGFIAKNNLNIATGPGSSQLNMTGAFYAQGQIKSAKQTNVGGTFVANFFDMGTNVPSIFQVPQLIYNMPPAMPGDKSFLSIKTKMWRERPYNPG